MAQSREGNGAPIEKAQEVLGSNKGKDIQEARAEGPSTWTPDRHNQREKESGPSEKAVPAGPQSEEGPVGIAAGRPIQVQEFSGAKSMYTDSSSGGVNHGFPGQGGETRAEVEPEFHKTQRQGIRAARTQWVPREKGCPPRGAAQLGKEGPVARIMETQAEDFSGEALVPGRGFGSTPAKDGLLLPTTGVEESSLPEV